MHCLHLATAVLNSGNDLGEEGQRLIEIENADLAPSIFVQTYLVLRLHCCVVDEYGVAFLYLNEGDVLVEGSLDDGVALMMLLHEHLETAEGDAKHLSELHWVHGKLLRVEHSWLLRLDVFELLYA